MQTQEQIELVSVKHTVPLCCRLHIVCFKIVCKSSCRGIFQPPILSFDVSRYVVLFHAESLKESNVELLGSLYYNGVPLPRIPSTLKQGTSSCIAQRSVYSSVGPHGAYSLASQSSTGPQRQYRRSVGTAQYAATIQNPINRAVLSRIRLAYERNHMDHAGSYTLIMCSRNTVNHLDTYIHSHDSSMLIISTSNKHILLVSTSILPSYSRKFEIFPQYCCRGFRLIYIHFQCQKQFCKVSGSQTKYKTSPCKLF